MINGDTKMSFQIRNLSVLAYANGFTLWQYRAGVARISDVKSKGFFNDASDMISPGDMIMITSADGATILFASSVTAGTVGVSPLA